REHPRPARSRRARSRQGRGRDLRRLRVVRQVDRGRATQGSPACDALHSVQAERGTPLASPEPRGGASRRVRLVALALGVTALDQLTKLAVVRALPEGESRPVIDDFLRLSDLRNSG